MHSFLFLCCRDLLVNPAEAGTRNWRESLSYQELALLGGLLVKRKFRTQHKSEDAVASQVSSVDALFDELHGAYMPPPLNHQEQSIKTDPTQLDQPQRIPDLLGMGDFFAESIFYAGSGAYDFQYLNLAVQRYESDNQWIFNRYGFSIDSACKIANQIKKIAESRLNDLKPGNDSSEIYDYRLNLFSFRSRDITVVSSTEVNDFLEKFSLEPGTVNRDFQLYGEYNAFEARPIIRLDDGRYLLPIHFLLAQSIYESPFYWTSADSAYRDTAFENRGRATTTIAHEMLAQVFGHDRIFQDVRVMRNKREAETDIDILAFVGDKAVVVQAKSKKLTQLARRGAEDHLRADFKSAIQDAYDQAVTCRRALLSHTYTLLTKEGEEVRLEEPMDEVYLICLVSDNYPGLSLQTTHLLDRAEEDPAPIALSLFDLEVLAYYLSDPFDFVHYQRQRAATAELFVADHELVLLAHYLNGVLRQNSEYDRVLLDASCAQWIDSYFAHMHGSYLRQAVAPRIQSESNEEFERLLDYLKNSGISGLTDAIFMLKELSTKSADKLIDLIKSTKMKTDIDGQRHSFSFTRENVKEQGISFICMTNCEDLIQDVIVYGVLKKYQLRASQWLSLGSFSGSSEFIDVASFSKIPWKPDAELDALSKKMSPKRSSRL